MSEPNDDSKALTYIPSLLIQSPLPIRDPGKKSFARKAGGQTLNLVSHYGIPFGHIGRMTLSLAVTEAVQNKTPHIDLGTIGNWMRRLEVSPTGGKNGSIARVREQFRRIDATYITWEGTEKGKLRTRNMGISAGMELWWTKKEIDALVPTLGENYLILNAEFLDYAIKHAVPTDLEMYSGFQAPQAQDIYAWLCWKLAGLDKALELRWEALIPQFSDSVPINPSVWRKRWLAHTLEILEKAYPGAKVKATDVGIRLDPSTKAIKPRSPGLLL